MQHVARGQPAQYLLRRHPALFEEPPAHLELDPGAVCRERRAGAASAHPALAAPFPLLRMAKSFMVEDLVGHSDQRGLLLAPSLPTSNAPAAPYTIYPSGLYSCCGSASSAPLPQCWFHTSFPPAFPVLHRTCVSSETFCQPLDDPAPISEFLMSREQRAFGEKRIGDYLRRRQ